MTEEKRVDDVMNRLNRMEDKIDKLMEFRWRLEGTRLALNAMLSIIISIAAIIVSKL